MLLQGETGNGYGEVGNDSNLLDGINQILPGADIKIVGHYSILNCCVSSKDFLRTGAG